MKKCFSTGIMLALSSMICVCMARAQAHKSNPNAGTEMFLTVEHPTHTVEITVTPLDLNEELPDVISVSSSMGSHGWEADFNCLQQLEVRDFECNTIYEFKFDAPGSNDLVFQYMQ